tara:strand:+ start:119 stop:547 length:429 start_codon:yes stop_codon:yes gene_type:complete
LTESSLITVDELQELAFERVPIAAELGMVVDSVSAGKAQIRLPYRETFVRPGGTVAGPVMMALADFAMFGVVLTRIGPVELAVTTSFNINFLHRPAPRDMLARGSLLKLGKRLAVMDVELYSAGNDIMVAHATGTYSIPPRP